MLGFGSRRVPHRGQAVAVIVDHHAAVIHHLVREPVENVGQQVEGFAGSNPLGKSREAAQIGEQEG
jgi:hypothetical protein